MKRIVLLLLLICLVKLAGAQVPEPSSHPALLTTTPGTPMTITLTTGTDGTNPADIKVLLARTRKLQAENLSLKGEVAALRARGEVRNSSMRQAVKESTAKVLFVVCLVAGLLLVALVSGQVLPREAYASRFNLNG